MKIAASDKGTGKSNSVTITNDSNRLKPEEVERMLREAEEYAAQDEEIRKRVESGNAFESFLSGLKSQVNDNEGLGGKLDSDDKKTILAEIKKGQDWLEEEGKTASPEDIDEKREEIQAVISPITAKVCPLRSGIGSRSHACCRSTHKAAEMKSHVLEMSFRDIDPNICKGCTRRAANESQSCRLIASLVFPSLLFPFMSLLSLLSLKCIS